MKVFARLDLNNKVTQIINVPDEYGFSSSDKYVESLAIKKLKQTYGYETNWKECVGITLIGDTYSESENKFITPKIFDSWIIDEDGIPQPPTPYPDDGEIYDWNEETEEWDVIE